MPSPRLSTRPRFDRGPIARGLGQVPRRRSTFKKSTRLEEGDDDEKPKDKPDEESDPDSEMEEGDETDPEDDEESDSKNVDMKGGKFGAGIIRRFSVITGSSVWLVKWGETDVQWVWGANGSLDTSEVRVESLIDSADSTKRFDGYVQTMQAYPGLQVASRLSIVRIKKLTADTGKGLTDDLIAQALMKFPTGIMPDAMFMSRRSLAQLQDSRTATNPTGAPAPFPVESHQVPILVTDGIVDTEALDL